MPDTEGTWTYLTKSNVAELDGHSGSFECMPNSENNHGPLHVADTFHFQYADGTPHIDIGTTCYSWVHQGDALAEQTLKTLASAPFNKMRMMLFPKYFRYCQTTPEYHAFADGAPNESKQEELNPAYWRNVEKRIEQLGDLGIEADLIFFTNYDFGQYGYDYMKPAAEDMILRYTVARLGAYRNVWWSLANEWDLIGNKTIADWERYFKIILESDPYSRLRSIHNADKWYDHTKPYITHVSVQSENTEDVHKWRKAYQKPIIVDECRYEGNVSEVWGNITPQMMTDKFWKGCMLGGYVGHAETYLNEEEILWWSKGGSLYGNSPDRIAFLKNILEEAPGPLTPYCLNWNNHAAGSFQEDYIIWYLGDAQSSVRDIELPGESEYTIDVIDAWEMTIESIGRFSQTCSVPLPGKPFMAVRAIKV